MVEDRLGQGWNFGPPAKHPPTEPSESTTDHRTDCATYRTTASDAGQQRAERVVIGEVLDEAEQQRGAQTGDTSQKSDEEDSANELKGAPTHWLNLSHLTLNS